MKKRFLVGFFLALILLTTGCARLQHKESWNRIEKDKTVVIGLDDSFVPMGFRQKNGQLTGFDIDLAKALFKRYGIRCDFQTIEWSMKETELKNQTIDLIWNGYSVTPARAKQVAFSKDYLVNHQLLVTKTADHINRYSDMKGKDLGVQTGSSGAAALDAKPKLLKQYIKGKTPVLYDTFTDAFLDLNAGRIQGIFMDEVYARYYIAHQKDPAAYHIIEGGFDSENFAVGMRKSDHVLRRKINEGFAAMEKDGTMARLKAKWFGKNAN